MSRAIRLWVGLDNNVSCPGVCGGQDRHPILLSLTALAASSAALPKSARASDRPSTSLFLGRNAKSSTLPVCGSYQFSDVRMRRSKTSSSRIGSVPRFSPIFDGFPHLKHAGSRETYPPAAQNKRDIDLIGSAASQTNDRSLLDARLKPTAFLSTSREPRKWSISKAPHSSISDYHRVLGRGRLRRRCLRHRSP